MTQGEILNSLRGSNIKRAYPGKDEDGWEFLVIEFYNGRSIRIRSECDISYGFSDVTVPKCPEVSFFECKEEA